MKTKKAEGSIVGILQAEPATARAAGLRALGGAWRNELGSELVLVAGDDGNLTGTLRSGVGPTRHARPLVGYHSTPMPDGSTLVAFTVQWPGAGSIAVWNGRHVAGPDRIHATWLLVSAGDAADAWKATCVGTDEFCRDEGGRGD